MQRDPLPKGTGINQSINQSIPHLITKSYTLFLQHVKLSLHTPQQTKHPKSSIQFRCNLWDWFQAVFTFGLSPPEASLSFSDCELSAIKCRSDAIPRLILYPEEPAPRGLDGQEFAAL